MRALAASDGGRSALIAPGCLPTSFASMARRAAHAEAALGALGIARGDVVAWTTTRRASTAAAIATLPRGCTLAPLSTTLTDGLAADVLARLAPKAVVLAPGERSSIERAARSMRLALLEAVDDGSGEAGSFELAVLDRGASLDRVERVPEEWALIGATSGTTGRPKLVPHGRRAIVATALAHGARLALGPEDCAAHLSPLHLAGGIRSGYFQGLLNGGATNVLAEFDLEAFVREAAAGRVTHVSTSFAFFRELLGRLDAGLAFAPGRLRFVRIASGRMAPDEMDRLEARLGVPVLTGLASSEAGTVAQQGVPPAVRVRGSVGAPVACEVRVVDERGMDVPAGEAGELWVRGPQVIARYHDDPELDARAFVDGWFRMGDLVRLDARGEIHVVGRVKDVINRGGEKIAPAEIDDALCALDGVVDAAAFALPHERLGEEVAAAVVLAPWARLSAEAVSAAVRERLGPRRAPRRLWFVDAIPRNPAGKVMRASLPAWVGFDPGDVGASGRDTKDAPAARRGDLRGVGARARSGRCRARVRFRRPGR